MPSAPSLRPRVAIIIPTADPNREPARTAIAQARATAAPSGASVHLMVSSGADFGFSRSVNRGMREAPDADAWILLNDDCFMDAGWIEAMMDAVRCHPGVGVVGAVLRFPNGRLQHAGAYFMRPARYLIHNTFANRAPLWAWGQVRRLRGTDGPLSGHYHRVNPRQRLGFITGACFLITRACRQRIGFFDEAYRFGFEDLDYSLRALEAGLELALAVDARGVHLQTATGGGLRDAWQAGEKVFKAKWTRPRTFATIGREGRIGVYHGYGPGASCQCLGNSLTQPPPRETVPNVP